MESSSFYITLPSNASMDYYSNNTACCYQIRMPRTFYLKGKYEVGLAEIQYPHTWATTREGLGYFINYRESPFDALKIASIPKGYYNTTQEICDAFNSIIDELEIDKPVWLKFNKITRRVYLKLKDQYEVKFSTGIADIFGFQPDQWYHDHDEAEHKADVKHGFYTLYVYCSICEPQVVGDYYVPLLRNVNIQGKDGDVIMKYYSEPHYVPVNTSKFDTIEINIKDDTGRNVSFQTGKVLCKLHFRQKAL